MAKRFGGIELGDGERNPRSVPPRLRDVFVVVTAFVVILLPGYSVALFVS